ncbi:MAG: rod shape-determining protein MreC, partial [Candidatus Krumholzibacteria bacterium]|nr:rod shape-determining protein MreC [Candidatus Krumholzibacteria bacterium]
MHALSFLFDKHLDKTVLAIAVALAIALLSLGEQSRIEKARAITSILLYPVERVTGRFASVEELKEENDELRAMVVTLYQERERLLGFGEERNRLRKLLDLKADTFYRFLPCEIVSRSSTSFFRSIMVDRGSTDSVRVGMAVVGFRGLVGRVSQVFPTSSQVVLINNKSISVSCMNRRSGVVGMLEWDRGSYFRLEYVGKEEDVAVGDTLVTSGLGLLFPKGFPVGTVFQIAEDRGGISKRVRVASSANLNALEELFIVKGAREWNNTEILDELEKFELKRVS